MKKGITGLLCVLLGMTIATAASAQVSAEDQIKFRKAGYSFAAWNMGKIKANLDGNYNKDQVVAAANAISAIANSGMGTLYGPGTDKDTGAQKTKLNPEAFKNMNELGKAATDFTAAATKLNEVAANGDKAAVGKAFGDVGATCKACHDKFRLK